MLIHTDRSSAEHLSQVMETLSLHRRLHPEVLVAALQLHAESISREEVVREARTFFQQKAVFVPAGLNTLPSAWLASLPTVLWKTRKPHWKVLPYFIRTLSFEGGVLGIGFSQEAFFKPEGISRCDQLRVVVNLCLRPNLWQPLSQHEEEAILQRRPELRQELMGGGSG